MESLHERPLTIEAGTLIRNGANDWMKFPKTETNCIIPRNVLVTIPNNKLNAI